MTVYEISDFPNEGTRNFVCDACLVNSLDVPSSELDSWLESANAFKADDVCCDVCEPF